MEEKINYVALYITFFAFAADHFLIENTNYHFWIVLFLFWIARAVLKRK